MARWPELSLLLGGAFLLASGWVVRLERDAYQRTQATRFEADLARSQPAGTRRHHGNARVSGSESLGRLEIPRLRISAMIAEGIDPGTLDHAIGHVPGTALPGNRGNATLAGHRDTFFRSLKGLRNGDRIRITTREGTCDYRVVFSAIVEPTQVDLMRPTRGRSLTLVTCYPFQWIGAAPQRFVVRAQA